MQRGANTRALDSDLYTPITVACKHQQLLCVQALLPHADLAHLDNQGASLLHLAAAHGGPAVLEVVCLATSRLGWLTFHRAWMRTIRDQLDARR